MARLDEFGLIQKITSSLPRAKDVIVGVGDDCAVIKQGGTYLLATIDAQVDGVHFNVKKTPAECIGKKAVAVNVSDIASMGGTPTHCLVSLFLSKGISQTFVERTYAGIRYACKSYSIGIVGGNITRADRFAIDIAMLGVVKEDCLLRRSGAKPGDRIFATGTLGDARAGLDLLQRKHVKLKKGVRQTLIARQTDPSPRLQASALIAHTRRASAMIDISDGLAQDALHLARASDAGITLYENALPMSRELRHYCAMTRREPLSYALSGGEDYELLFTAPARSEERLRVLIEKKTGTRVTKIGEVTRKKNGAWLVRSDGKKERLVPSGWDHLKL